jgi:hypothetical protein
VADALELVAIDHDASAEAAGAQLTARSRPSKTSDELALLDPPIRQPRALRSSFLPVRPAPAGEVERRLRPKRRSARLQATRARRPSPEAAPVGRLCDAWDDEHGEVIDAARDGTARACGSPTRSAADNATPGCVRRFLVMRSDAQVPGVRLVGRPAGSRAVDRSPTRRVLTENAGLSARPTRGSTSGPLSL